MYDENYVTLTSNYIIIIIRYLLFYFKVLTYLVATTNGYITPNTLGFEYLYL